MQAEFTFCPCGCGLFVRPGRRFVHGHCARVLAPPFEVRFWSKVEKHI